LKSLPAWLSSIATGDPCVEGENEGVAEEQFSADTNTEMKLIGRDGKYHFFSISEKSCSICLAFALNPVTIHDL
jgi:hypothetical protein